MLFPCSSEAIVSPAVRWSRLQGGMKGTSCRHWDWDGQAMIVEMGAYI